MYVGIAFLWAFRKSNFSWYMLQFVLNSCFSCVFKLTDELDEYKTIAEKTCEVNKCIVLLSYIYCELSNLMISIFKDWKRKKKDKNTSD